MEFTDALEYCLEYMNGIKFMEAGTYMLETVFINAGIFIVLNVY